MVCGKTFGILLFISLLASACATHMQHSTAKGSEKDEDFAIIDAHVHNKFSGNPNRFSKIVDSRDSFIKEMTANHVVGAVCHKHFNEDWAEIETPKVIHCPILPAIPDVKKLEAGLRDKTYRCLKVYLGYIPQFANDPHYEPAYQLAEKYNVPVVYHTGDVDRASASVKYADPMLIDDVAVKHPKMIIVLAHMGNPWVQTAAELIYKNDNVYGDLSSFLVGDLSSRSPEDIEEYVIKPIRWAYGYIEDPHKLMYATDWPLTDMKSYIWAVKRAIPREHWKDVFYNNAQAVFKIPGLPDSE